MTDMDTLVEDGYGRAMIGRTITAVRPMTADELAEFAWSPSRGDMPVVIELDDGTMIIPSRDFEGNGPGALFVEAPTS